MLTALASSDTGLRQLAAFRQGLGPAAASLGLSMASPASFYQVVLSGEPSPGGGGRGARSASQSHTQEGRSPWAACAAFPLCSGSSSSDACLTPLPSCCCPPPGSPRPGDALGAASPLAIRHLGLRPSQAHMHPQADGGSAGQQKLVGVRGSMSEGGPFCLAFQVRPTTSDLPAPDASGCRTTMARLVPACRCCTAVARSPNCNKSVVCCLSMLLYRASWRRAAGAWHGRPSRHSTTGAGRPWQSSLYTLARPSVSSTPVLCLVA